MLIRAAKAVIVHPDNSRILLLRRSGTHPNAPYTNDLPGGKIEDGESMIVGLKREIREETAINVNAESIKSLFRDRIDNYYGKNYEIEFFEVRLTQVPEVELSFEHDRFMWSELAAATVQGELFEKFLNKYKSSR